MSNSASSHPHGRPIQRDVALLNNIRQLPQSLQSLLETIEQRVSAMTPAGARTFMRELEKQISRIMEDENRMSRRISEILSGVAKEIEVQTPRHAANDGSFEHKISA